MENKKRVLIAGWCQSNFIKQLYSSIHKVSPDKYDFDVYGLHELSGKDEYDLKIFDHVYKVRDKLTLRDLVNLFHPRFIILVLTFIRYGAPIKQLVLFVKNNIIAKSQYDEFKSNNYDVVHLHSPVLSNLHLLWHIPQSVKCIVTFWGSDLMRNKGVFNYYVQYQAVRRADVITVHSSEMKQKILTKYGRDLDSKILITRFPPYDGLYASIEETLAKPESYYTSFFESYNIPHKKVVVIGHNGTPANNHIQIIESLASLPEEIKQNLYCILPFSYAKSKDGSYEDLCKVALDNAGLQGTVLKEFLTWNNLAIFKCITDIMIHMPISDALSAAITEAMFSGAKVITGDWLPYSPFKNEGLIYYTTDFEGLSEKFIEAYMKLPKAKEMGLINREIIKQRFLSDFCARTWLPVLN